MKRAFAVVLAACLLLGLGMAEEVVSDFSALSWSDAFSQLHGRLAREYAFTDWKGVDWAALGDEFGPRIRDAEAASDFEAYYLALREYVHAIPDGHVRAGNLPEIDDKHIGGGFGFCVAALDDESAIAAWVDEGSPAFAAGLRAGDELLTWNGEPVGSALSAVSPIFDGNAATAENLRQKQAAYLARAPVGEELLLTFRSESGETNSAALTAYADGGLSLKKAYPDAVLADPIRALILGVESPDPLPEKMVEWKLLDGNVGYIRVWGEVDADLQDTGALVSTLQLFRDAVRSAVDHGCGALIVDLRNNIGGEDAMAAAMLGCLCPEKTFYEYQNAYDPATGALGIQGELWIEPFEPVFPGKIVALVNQKCVSSGEGVAMGIRNLLNGETLGFFGTNGSFGLCGPEAQMPGGVSVHWPSGQSLDENKQIQLDSRDGVGGVEPTVRVPMTRENALRVAAGEDVELSEALRMLNS
ncbi:MAG: hypothetical protein GX647_04910 [Clostridiales bacterium]|jgi:carboxyl-terminal processing protease|nr:hypothetical protein [Clostridiales bacterium]